jgi:hypothetical protein
MGTDLRVLMQLLELVPQVGEHGSSALLIFFTHDPELKMFTALDLPIGKPRKGIVILLEYANRIWDLNTQFVL